MEAWEYDGLRFFRPKPGFSDGLAETETISLLRFKNELISAVGKIGHRVKAEYRHEGCLVSADVVVEREGRRPLAVLLRNTSSDDTWAADATELTERGFDVLALVHAGDGTKGDWPIKPSDVRYYGSKRTTMSYDGWYGVSQPANALRFYVDFDSQRIRFGADWHAVDEFVDLLLSNRFRVGQKWDPRFLSVIDTSCWKCNGRLLLWMCEWRHSESNLGGGVYPRGHRLEELYAQQVAEWAASHDSDAKPCLIRDRICTWYDFRYRAFVCPHCGVTQGETYVRKMDADYLIPVLPSDSSAKRYWVAFLV